MAFQAFTKISVKCLTRIGIRARHFTKGVSIGLVYIHCKPPGPEEFVLQSFRVAL